MGLKEKNTLQARHALDQVLAAGLMTSNHQTLWIKATQAAGWCWRPLFVILSVTRRTSLRDE
jgi:hypothetical protein